jgi:flagellar hook protein FlgE
MGSFSIPLSGLLASQADLSVISNNLANLNTTGFKGSSANFSDLVYEQLGNSGAGNPIQKGLGTQIGSTSISFTQGSIQNTGVNTNVAIQGGGFLQVQNNGLTLYSRNGNLALDPKGYLVTQDGSQVLGFPVVNGVVSGSGSTAALQINQGQTSPAKATSSVQLNLNLDATAKVGDTFPAPVSIYDSLGASHVVTFNFINNGGNSWNYSATMPGAEVLDSAGKASSTPVSLVLDSSGGTTGTVTFNPDGTLATPTADVTGITLPTGYTLADNASVPAFDWNLFDSSKNPVLTQVAGASATSSTEQDGYPAGTLQSFTILQDGTIQGSFSNGQVTKLGQIALATFPNEQGLLQTGNGNYMSSLASGLPSVGVAGTGGRGTLQAGALEGSNVDISTQFSKLILAQQSYQANARAFNISAQIFNQSTLNLGQ